MGASRVIAYGLLGLPLAFAALPVYVHVPRFYAEVAGMELAWLGFILLGARLLDAVIDPWLGWLADRSPRRGMLALALLPFATGFVALLNPPSGAAGPWLLGSLALTYLGFSAATVVYQAWGADIGGDAESRTRLTASREGFGLLGSCSRPHCHPCWPRPGGRYCPSVVDTASAVAGRAAATTRRLSGQVPAASAPLWGSLRRVLSDIAFRRLLIVFIANGIAAALPATLFLFSSPTCWRPKR